jgi:hypothetical protein
MDEAAEIASHLVGHRLIGVDSNHGWVFKFENDISLRAECPWRILIEGRIALGNADHRQGLPEPFDAGNRSELLLRDKLISGVGIRDDTGDLTINFGAQAALEILNNHGGFEAWQLYAESLTVVAVGGGELFMFQPK